MIPPCCYDCLTGDVSVKLIDELGFEHWFCAACWAAREAFRDRVQQLIDDGLARFASALEAAAP